MEEEVVDLESMGADFDGYSVTQIREAIEAYKRLTRDLDLERTAFFAKG